MVIVPQIEVMKDSGRVWMINNSKYLFLQREKCGLRVCIPKGLSIIYIALSLFFFYLTLQTYRDTHSCKHTHTQSLCCSSDLEEDHVFMIGWSCVRVDDWWGQFGHTHTHVCIYIYIFFSGIHGYDVNERLFTEPVNADEEGRSLCPVCTLPRKEPSQGSPGFVRSGKY